jgi:hypothetical protein
LASPETKSAQATILMTLLKEKEKAWCSFSAVHFPLRTIEYSISDDSLGPPGVGKTFTVEASKFCPFYHAHLIPSSAWLPQNQKLIT